MTSPSRIALGTGALFLGGLLGGIVVAWMVSRSVPAGGSVAGTSVGQAELAGVLRELVDEVARLGRVETLVRASEREPAAGEPPGTSLGGGDEAARVVAALDRLTEALASAPARAATGAGGGNAPLVMPPAGSRKDALAALVGREWDQLSREHRFWTFQQVLDRYGPPDEVTNGGQWLYHYPDNKGASYQTFSFQFADGYLTNIYL
jgi:hypothetical protein